MKKTTKIVGAVLGVLLVAALFTGAVAAADINKTHYAYVFADDLSANANETWYLLNDQGNMTTTTVTIKKEGEKYYIDGLEEEGWYKSSTWTTEKVLVKFPTIVAKAKVNYDGTVDYTYPLDGNFLPKDAAYTVTIDSVTGPVSIANVEWELINADGAATKVSYTANKFDFSTKKAGEYALVPYIKEDSTNPILVKDAPEGMEYGEPIFFTLGKADDEKVVLSAESANVGETFVATIHGLPGVKYTVTTPYDTIDNTTYAVVSIPDQKGVTPITPTTETVPKYWKAEFTMGASGVFDISLKAEKKVDEANIKVIGNRTAPAPVSESFDASIEITEGIITAEAEFDAYTIGDKIKLFGTSSGQTLYFHVEGINVKLAPIAGVSVTEEEWEKEITYAQLKTANKGADLDAGTYTIYVSTNKDDAKDKDATYVAVPVALKQSFISITNAPTVVAQGEKVVIEGTANAAKSVLWYVFGTNYFVAGSKNVKDDVFKITIDKDVTEDMAAGQYFLVIQHPMYDEKYSIGPDTLVTAAGGKTLGTLITDVKNIQKFDTGLFELEGSTFKKVENAAGVNIFGTDVRQTANAAQALCDALDSQNFDDMYAKASFIVGAPTSVINPIPAKIAHGEILKISGTTTGHVGDIVSVEFLATAFAAVPKEAVGTAAFVTVNTKVQDDGTWAIEFDTSNLNVDDYTVSVAVGSLGPTTAKLTVVKAGEPVPTQTTVPTGQPTTAPTTAPTQTPASPGFGILAALAGLGAVAVLLLRRQ